MLKKQPFFQQIQITGIKEISEKDKTVLLQNQYLVKNVNYNKYSYMTNPTILSFIQDKLNQIYQDYNENILFSNETISKNEWVKNITLPLMVLDTAFPVWDLKSLEVEHYKTDINIKTSLFLDADNTPILRLEAEVSPLVSNLVFGNCRIEGMDNISVPLTYSSVFGNQITFMDADVVTQNINQSNDDPKQQEIDLLKAELDAVKRTLSQLQQQGKNTTETEQHTNKEEGKAAVRKEKPSYWTDRLHGDGQSKGAEKKKEPLKTPFTPTDNPFNPFLGNPFFEQLFSEDNQLALKKMSENLMESLKMAEASQKKENPSHNEMDELEQVLRNTFGNEFQMQEIKPEDFLKLFGKKE